MNAGRSPHRVLLGTQEVAGWYGRLLRGFDDLGVPAVLVDFSADPFRYGTRPRGPFFVRLATVLGRRRARTPRSRPAAKIFWTAAHMCASLPVLVWASARFDVFILGFGSSLLGTPEQPYLDGPLLRLLGKRVIVVFHGSDSRPPYMDGALMSSDGGRTTEDCLALTRQARRRVARAERFADAIVTHGPHAHFLRSPFAQTLLVGIPGPVPPGADAARSVSGVPSIAPRRPGPVRVLHAPSHPEAKGTPEIRRAVESLRAQGLAIDYREITGEPNDVVMRAIEEADFVVDQLYSDIPTPVFATEAAAHGKPAIVGGYAWAEVRRTMAADAIPPVELCHPDDLAASIHRLATDEPYRLELGRRSRAFVTERWAAREIAARYLRIVDEGIPTDWLGDPGDIQYVRGACISEARCRALTRAVVDRGGPAALGLDHAPPLRTLVLELAGDTA